MQRKVIKYLFGILPLPFADQDVVSKDSKTAASFYSGISEETGWDRLHAMFSIDEFSAVSPELHSVYQSSFLAFFTGACVGGILRSRTAYLDFMERNQATSFTSHLEAKRKLQDYVTVNFAKGAFQWGWRLSLFCGSYVLVTTSISVYRGRSSLLEYAVAGGITGATYKMSLGLRAMAVGGLLGTVLGSVAGGASLLVLHLSGTSMEEVRYWQHGWKKSRTRQEQIAYKEYQEDKEDPLLKHHESKVGPARISLDTLVAPQATPKT